ncbi:MAG: hypothetical protein ACM31C_29685 [Acidobacteriota bacterium]
MKPSHDDFDDVAQTIPFAKGTPAPDIIAKPRAVAAAAVEIKHQPAPNGTMIGLPAFPAVHDTIPDGARAGVAPAQVSAAIAKVNVEKEVTAKVEAPRAPGEWESFEDIGLAPNKVTNKAQKLVVSSYRLLGFGILSLIVIVLVGYIATTAFYFLNHTWVTPVAISANDDKVVALQAQLAAQLNERAKLAGDLDQAERTIAAEQAFQLQFAKAIKKDLEGRRMALATAQQLAHSAAATRQQIKQTNGDYSDSTVARMKDEYDAGLIDRQAMLAGKFQLAQITSANLSLAERQAEYDQRAAELAAETQSLDAILADKTQTAALSYDVLKIQRDYEASKLALAKDMDDRERLKASLERMDQIVAGVKQSAYLRALEDHATVALVPYANLGGIAKGTPLYACKLSMVGCHEAGTVLDVLPGEVLVKNPHRDSIVRGKMIELKMTDQGAAEDEVLFAGSKPLWF